MSILQKIGIWNHYRNVLWDPRYDLLSLQCSQEIFILFILDGRAVLKVSWQFVPPARYEALELRAVIHSSYLRYVFKWLMCQKFITSTFFCENCMFTYCQFFFILNCLFLYDMPFSLRVYRCTLTLHWFQPLFYIYLYE